MFARSLRLDQVDVGLVEDQVGFELAGVADLEERLAGLEVLADRRACAGTPDHLAVAGGDQGQLADLLADLGDRRLELLLHLEVLLGLGPAVVVGEAAEPERP